MNNFLFNLLKDEEEKAKTTVQEEVKEEPIVNDPVIAPKKKKRTFFNLFPGDNPRKEALIKLSIGFGFLIVLVVFINIFGETMPNVKNDDNNKDTDTQAMNVFEYVKKNDYTFTYQISTLIDNEEYNYTYMGYNDDSIIYGERIFNDMKLNYKRVDNNYYCMQDDVEVLCDVNEVFLNNIYNYIDFDFIETYVSKGKLNYTTSYTDGSIEKNYSVYFKDFIASYIDGDYFVINLIENNDSYSINVDYTNLSKYSDPLVLKFVVDIKIGKIIGRE